MRRGRNTGRLAGALLLLALLLAAASPAHATYLRVFIGSEEWAPGVDVDRVETRIRMWNAPNARWYVQNRTLVSDDFLDLFDGEVEAASFGPMRLGTYEVVVILWDGQVWRDWQTINVPVGALGSPDPVLWLPEPSGSQPPRVKIAVVKSDSLSVDWDGDGAVSVGDRVAYLVTLANADSVTLNGVVYEDRHDAIFQGQIVQEPPDATMTKQGSPPSTSAVSLGFDPPSSWSQKLTANIGTLTPGQWAQVRFEVVIGQLGTLSRGYAWADGYSEAVVSDDPTLPGAEDLTIIPITFAGPNLCRAQLPIALSLAYDHDGDGLITAVENQLGTSPSDPDTDGDGLGDFDEVMGPDGVEGTGDESDPLDADSDNDQTPDGYDNCVLVRNKFQENDDGDAFGNACDGCPNLYNGERADLDRDGAWDVCDVCPLTHDPDQLDDHGFPSASPDGTGNACQTLDFDLDGRADLGDVTQMREALAEIDAPPDGAMPPRGCAPGVAEQAFTPSMSGCEGAIAWADRVTLCATGWSACTAAEWVARRQGKLPTANYWTDDDLRWGGTSGACWAHESSGTACTAGRPMRVCAAGTDHLWNTCNWTGCGYQSAPPPNEYFGGCNVNPTAGTLCCR